MSVIDSLYVLLGFKVEDTKLKDFIRALGELDMKSVASAFGLNHMYESFQKIMEIADATAMKLDAFSRTTGMSTKELQQWSTFAEMMGVSAEEVTGSAKHLMDAVTRLRLTGEGAEGWNRLGIDPNAAKDSFELFSMVGEALNDLDPASRRSAMQLIGLSDSMIPVLLNGYRMKDVIKDIIVVGDEQKEALAKNHSAWARLKSEWTVLVTDIGARLAPLLERIAVELDKVVRFADKHPIIQQAFMAIAASITAIAIATGILASKMALISLFTWVTGLGEVAVIVGAIATGIALIAANWEKLTKLPNWLKMLSPAMAIGTYLQSTNTVPSGSASSFAAPDINSVLGAGKTTYNKVTFNVAGNNPEDIANRINERFERFLSDAEMQTGA